MEETKDQVVPLYKRRQMQADSGEVDFSSVHIAKLEGPSILKTSTSEIQQRAKTGLNMGLLKGLE